MSQYVGANPFLKQAARPSTEAAGYPSISVDQPVGYNQALDPAYDAEILAQQSAYDPAAPEQKRQIKLGKGEKKATVIRKGSGKTWEDPTLVDWDPDWKELFVGNISNDVTDKTLIDAFSKYETFEKARVVKDHRTGKARYGFVAFSNPEDYLKAFKEMRGAFVGNRPIVLKPSKGSTETVQIGAYKQRLIAEGLDGGTDGTKRAKAGGKTGHGRIGGVARPTPY